MLLILILTSFAVCFLGAVVPVISAEAYVLGAAAILSTTHAAVLVVAAAAGQTLGKLVPFYSARATAPETLLPARLRPWIGGRACFALVFISAFASLPPLYATTLACGAARVRATPFLLFAFAGRCLRTALLVGSVVFLRGIQ